MPTGEDTYWIFVKSSFADYLLTWLRDAMAEYALPSPGTLR